MSDKSYTYSPIEVRYGDNIDTTPPYITPLNYPWGGRYIVVNFKSSDEVAALRNYGVDANYLIPSADSHYAC